MSWTKLKNCNKIFVILILLLPYKAFAQLDTIIINLDKLLDSDTTVIINYNISDIVLENIAYNHLKIPMRTITEDSLVTYLVSVFKANTIIKKVGKSCIVKNNSSIGKIDWHLYKYIPSGSNYTGRTSMLTHISFYDLMSNINYHKSIEIRYNFIRINK